MGTNNDNTVITGALAATGATLVFDRGTTNTDLIGIDTTSATIDDSTQLIVAGGIIARDTPYTLIDDVIFTGSDQAAYLEGLSYDTMLRSRIFSITGGALQVAIARLDGTNMQLLQRIATNLGYGDLAAGADPSYADMVRGAVSGVILPEPGIGQVTRGVLKGLGGDASDGYDFRRAPAVARAAYQATHGKHLVNTLYLSADAALQNIERVGESLTDLGSGMPAAGQAAISSGNGYASYVHNLGERINRFRVSGLGSWLDADQRGNNAGYRYNSGGFMMAIDSTIGQALTLGGAFGYTTGDYEDKAVLSNASTIRAYSLTAYANYRHRSGLFAHLIGGYVYSNNDVEVLYTLIDRESADYHIGTWSGEAALGYEWRPVDRLRVAPSAGIRYYHSRSNRFASTTKENVRLRYHRGEIPLEMSLSWDAIRCGNKRLAINAVAGWSYGLSDQKGRGDFRFIGYSPDGIHVEGRDPGRHAFKAGTGLRYNSDTFDIGLDYRYRHRGGADSHAVSVSFGIGF